jgi:hypothetical protein
MGARWFASGLVHPDVDLFFLLEGFSPTWLKMELEKEAMAQAHLPAGVTC